MQLDTIWIVVIIVVALAAIAGTITTLKKNNKPFDFPEGYEDRQVEREKKNQSNDDRSGLV